MQIEGYPYLYETHLHTSQGSGCGHNTGAEMARAAIDAGYAGIIVTDHNWGGHCAVDRRKPWEQWVDEFTEGYRDAWEYGQEHGLDVFFGYEAGYDAVDFLINGITPQWLRQHPELKSASIKKQYKLVHDAGGMVIHAHPFRLCSYIPKVRLFPDYVDGVEGFNAGHLIGKREDEDIPEFDRKAVNYAREHNFPLTAGSDIHETSLRGGGVAFKRRLTSGSDYCKAILDGEDYVLTNGDAVFDKQGNLLYRLRD